MNTQKIKLNLVPGGIPPIVHVSQYDVGRPLAFEIYDGMSAATIESGTVIDIRATKPDGTGFEYACTWANNVVSIATQAQMTVLAGQIECELHFIKDALEIGTANFILEVETAALRGDTVISETELPDIIDLARSHEQAAAASAEAAATSESNAADSAEAAATSESNAADSASAAATSETNAADSASAAATSETNAADSASAAATSETNAADSASAAATSETNAAASETAAATSKSDAEAYAVGKRNGVDVPSTDPTYNNNAKHYSEVAQQAAAGGILPQGTTTFEQLPALADTRVGAMWNISNAFTTTADFREGAGIKYGAGSNIYKTSDGKWDVMAGWFNDTKDMVTTFTSSDNAGETGIITSAGGDTAMSKMTSGDTHGGLFSGLSKVVLNTRKLVNTVKRVWNSVGATWVSGHAYAVNDMVVYKNGHVYKCILAHTSSSSILPTNTTYWTDTTLAAEIASLNSNFANINPKQIASGSISANSKTYGAFAKLVWDVIRNYSLLELTRVTLVLSPTTSGRHTPVFRFGAVSSEGGKALTCPFLDSTYGVIAIKEIWSDNSYWSRDANDSAGAQNATNFTIGYGFNYYLFLS